MTAPQTNTDAHVYTVITRTNSGVIRRSEQLDDLTTAIEHAESERMDPDNQSATVLMDGFPVL